MFRALFLRARPWSAAAAIGFVTFLVPAAAGAQTITVRAGENLQTALDAAQAGDTILLEAGALFSGNFTLPVKAGAGYITIRSSTSDQYLPAAGTRITPAHAPLLPRIQSPNTLPALKTAPGAHHWRLVFLEFGANDRGYGEIMQLGDGSSAQYDLSQVPYEIEVDRVYIHGDPTLGQKRGIALNARAVTIRNSHISDIKWVGQDSQAIGGWNGPGPYTIENNFLEGAGENVLLGGADPAIPNLVTEDVVFRWNYVSKPMTWRGQTWQVKNLFELKNARRVRVEYNVFENNWAAAQPGYAILFTPRNQSGGCSWCVVEQVTFQYNIVRNTAAGINMTGYDDLAPSAQTNTINIRHNLFYGVTKALGGNGWFMLIGNTPRDIVVDHNTIDADGTTVMYAHGGTAADPSEIYGFQFTNNAARHNSYGINGANFSFGNSAINAYFPGSIIQGNWLPGGSLSRYPSGNRFDGAFTDGFVSVATADYRPIEGGILIGGATDGTNIGADMTTLATGTAGVADGSRVVLTAPVTTTTDPVPSPTEPAPSEPTPTEPTPTEPTPSSPSASSPAEIVLYARDAPVLAGNWRVVTDATAAGGARVWDPDQAAAKLTAALGTPLHYFQMTFDAEAGRGYRLWLRGIAERDYWGNDSVFVQFSGSVNATGTPVFRIGTADATWVNLEDGSGAGLSGWGWQDNGYGAGVLGPLVYFAETGPQTIRIQTREDGFSIDQVVLSAEKYVATAPGALTNDATILALATTVTEPAPEPAPAEPAPEPAPVEPSPEPAPAPPPPIVEVVVSANQATALAGTWAAMADPSAAGGVAVGSPDARAKANSALAAPASYVEFTFEADAGRPYRLWVRGRAEKDKASNDSVFVQFSGAVDNSGNAAWRIGTTASTSVTLEDFAGAGLTGWGWQDNGSGAGVLGPTVQFANSGPQTIRIQTREDGFRLDQVVLSAEKYLHTAPGALKNDATILR